MQWKSNFHELGPPFNDDFLLVFRDKRASEISESSIGMLGSYKFLWDAWILRSSWGNLVSYVWISFPLWMPMFFMCYIQTSNYLCFELLLDCNCQRSKKAPRCFIILCINLHPCKKSNPIAHPYLGYFLKYSVVSRYLVFRRIPLFKLQRIPLPILLRFLED